MIVSKSTRQRRMERDAKRLLHSYQIRRRKDLWDAACKWAVDQALMQDDGNGGRCYRWKEIWPSHKELARYYLMLVVLDFHAFNFPRVVLGKKVGSQLSDEDWQRLREIRS